MTVRRLECVSVKMSADEKKVLAELAESEDRSAGALIRWLVAQHAKQARNKTGAAA